MKTNNPIEKKTQNDLKKYRKKQRAEIIQDDSMLAIELKRLASEFEDYRGYGNKVKRAIIRDLNLLSKDLVK